MAVPIRTRRRIINDFRDLMKNPLDSEGIYVSYDETNMLSFDVLIIGPEDTPYQNGFYLFKGEFPINYPMMPPKIKFVTTTGNERFNPNLYENGKLCLSILNTWHGPGWTPSNTIRSVLITILGHIFNRFPLMNEPGYET